MIKQEPCDKSSTDFNDTCIPTTEESEDVNWSIIEHDIGAKKNIHSPIRRFCTITADQIQKKNFFMDCEKTGNGKCIRQDKDFLVMDENIKNEKTLTKRNDIKKSNRKRGKDIQATKVKKSVVYCEICFLPYENLNKLKRHKNFYTKQNNYLSNCSLNSFSHLRPKNNEKVRKYSTHSCHFCKILFKRKDILQGHLFHIHGEEIKLNIKDSSFSIDHSTVSNSNKAVKNKMRQKTMMEYILNRNEIGANSSPDNSNNSNIRRVSRTIKKETELMDDGVDQSSMDGIVTGVPQTSQKPNGNRTQQQPFVKIHVDSDMMKALLGMSCLSNDDGYLEKSSLYSSNISSRNNNTNSKRYALRSLRHSVELNNSEPSTNVRKNDQNDSNVRKLLSNCKKCTISLIRCDDKLFTESSLNSSSKSKSSPKSNSSRKLAGSSSQNLQVVKRKYRKRKLSRRKSNGRESPSKNCFPQRNNTKDFIINDSPVRSPPVKVQKRITKRKSNSSITLNSKRSTKLNSRHKKPRGRPRLLTKKSHLDQSKNDVLLRKANVKNPNSSSSRKQSDSTVSQNNPSTSDVVKLKEVKVSLVKLPEVKVESVVSEINENAMASTIDINFPCKICDSLLTSERLLKKHMKKCHTAYISSICRARYASKRMLLRHYLREHDMWVCKCCVCYQFFNSRLLLKKHLLLHCIKITLSKNDRPLSSKNMKCHSYVKRYKCKRNALKILLQSQSIEHQTNDPNDRNDRNDGNDSCDKNDKKLEHQDDNYQEISEENVQVDNTENLTNEVGKSEENDVSGPEKVNDQQAVQTVPVELTNQIESNNTEVSLSRNNELIRIPISNAMYAAGESNVYNTNRVRKIQLISHTNVIQSTNSCKNESRPVIEATAYKQKHPCSICGTQFMKPQSLLQHLCTYDQSFNNYCEICGIFFSKNNLLKAHINSTHNFAICNLYTLHCQFCNQGFRTENNLRIHELHYHASAVTINSVRITELLKIPNESNNLCLPTSCSICGLSFSTYERYQLHSLYYYKGHIFPCTFCDKIFHGLNMVHRHNKLFHFPKNHINTPSYKYKCSICYEGFEIEPHFHAHKLHVHSNKEHIESSISNFPLDSMHYNKMNKSYICSKCNIEFCSIAELMIHIEYYSNRGTFLCLKCPRKCCTLSILSEHINLTHNNNKSMIGYKCGICGEILMSDISFMYHQNHLHSDEANQNQVVSLSYKYSNANLNINEIIDNDKLAINKEPIVIVRGPTTSFVSLEKFKISCPICAVKFEKEVHLKEHLAEYLDFGDYRCDECQRQFVSTELLKKHIENHLAPGMPLTKHYCTVCNENCKSSIVLESHVAHLHARVLFKDDQSKPV